MSIVNDDQIGKEKWRNINIGIWMTLSIIWIGGGIRMIMRHTDFGWFLVAIWVFVLVMYMRHAFRN